MLNVDALLSSKGRQFRRQKPASNSELETLISAYRYPLPSLYLELLKFSNGGEGPLKVQPYTFVCFDINEALTLNRHPHHSVWLKEFVVIGGDGAGELIAIDYRKPSSPMVAIDMVNSNLDEVLHISPDFESFLECVGIESPDLQPSHFENL